MGMGFMSSYASGSRRRGSASACLRMLLLAALALLGSLVAERQAMASDALIAASSTANSGLSACSSNRGKALYDCVAGVLDRLSNEISPANVPNTQRSLQSAASQLRAATTKAQALSAISQCQSAIAGALRQVKAAGGGAYIQGWGDGGLSAIAGVLSRAASLIQSKG